MNSFDLIRLATINFLRSKIRSFLTILGVVIGTASIVVMLSVGLGMNEGFKQQVSQMGSLTTIDVYPGGGDGGMMIGGGGKTGTAKLDDKAVQTMSAMKGVQVATPLVQTSAKVIVGKYMAWIQLTGIRPEAIEKLGYKAATGRLLEETDTDSLLFGFGVPMNFYNPKSRVYQPAPQMDLLTEKMQLTFDTMYGENTGNSENPGQEEKQPSKLYKIKASGVLVQSNNERDWSVYMNLEHLNKLLRENSKANRQQGMGNNTQSGYQRAIVQVTDMKYVEPVREEIKKLGFSTSALTDVLKGMQEQSKMMRMLLGSIGAISLVVAAIGIANTMIMSIYERTREIGIMKVLGCELKDIRRLFLLEAGFIGFFGGILGVLASIGASYLLNKFGGSLLGSTMGGGGMVDANGVPIKSSIIPLWLMGSSVVFATLIGLISGFYPARRAMKLSALEAIKTE
ncbi:FtsX-like permease family protein [Gorillibacterium sp. CAU 1737]|uniref:ABC transporter permease n=1 Tax=Gorillibacterium sp. CAU 1737 TaxID=3140362 RepID=UPI0032606D72